MAGALGDITNNLLGLQQLAAGRKAMHQEEEAVNNNRIASESLRKYYESEQSGAPDYNSLQEAFLRSPDLSLKMLQGAGITDKRKGQDAASYAIEAYGAIDDPERFIDLTKKRISYLQANGRDASQSLGALEAYANGKKEQVRNGTKILLASLTNQGHIDKDVFSDLTGAGSAGLKVQSSNILDDGTVLQVLSNGQTRVVDSEGNPVEGEARSNAIRNAQSYGVGLQSARAGGRTSATIDARILGGGIAEQIEAEGTGSGKGVATRRQDFIDRGVAAAEGVPTVKRALALLESVPTGGIDKVSLQARQLFGIEGADEGELSYNLGKSVLSQLRETFGAAFTASEGERLQQLEASIGRNPETNRRILSQTLQLMNSKAKRGKSAAKDAGDDFTAQSIDEYLGMSLDPNKSGKGNQPQESSPAANETAAQRLARLRGGN